MSPPQYTVVLHAGAAESWVGDAQTRESTGAFLHQLITRAEHELRKGAQAVEVVKDLVCVLEDYPQFNAGKGSAINIDGFHELEAAIIDGRTCKYRAAGGLQRTKNPIKLAHAMLDSPAPALVIGPAADELAAKRGLEIVENSYFTTPSRRRYWESRVNRLKEDHGTVGAVALDMHGNLAAANSTGGVTFKSSGRIGDTAIVGAGIYADDHVAIVCSGSGDAILQATVAGRAAADARAGMQLNTAVQKAVLKSAELFPESSCGVIAVDAVGNLSIHCNSRIFAVASASASASSTAVQAGIIPSTIPVLTQLAFYEDELMKAGVAKYPTLPNQIVLQFKSPAASSLTALASDAFSRYFLRIRNLVQKVQDFHQAKTCGFVTGGNNQAFLFPLTGARSQEGLRDQDCAGTQGEEEDCSAQTNHENLAMVVRPLSHGHQARFYHDSPGDDTLNRVEIHPRYASSEDFFFSVDIDQYSQVIYEVWKMSQTISAEFGLDVSGLRLEIHPWRNCVTISPAKNASSVFPIPAPFQQVCPKYLSTELGPRAESLADLAAVALKLSKHLS